MREVKLNQINKELKRLKKEIEHNKKKIEEIDRQEEEIDKEKEGFDKEKERDKIKSKKFLSNMSLFIPAFLVRLLEDAFESKCLNSFYNRYKDRKVNMILYSFFMRIAFIIDIVYLITCMIIVLPVYKINKFIKDVNSD
ncbi:MAG: hypothetical protein A2086_09605 [Spirochaetes bacterium GWD1_27_9]|nr:MAG: hypothetical protein A2Z98_14135 [Spirochaetes bacterium GWB1_27_13]OHD25979.1 MAG: hypothetical protein A2Y34_07035 [Spirochaetes bacterium GWC1_27_15]OHD31657.1 MAG: hypothetical protein A2086_09605 [Spirochaetes bacterium GWD1_27_9]